MASAPPMIARDPPEVNEARAALVTRWQKDVLEAKKHWKKDFDRMRRNMDFAAGKQWPQQRDQDDRYVANIVQRVLKTTVSSLYAKNPTAVATRRKRLDFTLWDGKPESAMAALQALQAAAQAVSGAPAPVAPPEAAPAPPPDPATVMQAMALIADIQQGVQRREMIDKVGETLICLLEYYLDEAKPTFKGQLKRAVRRTRTTGVGYVKLGFQRVMELTEDQQSSVEDFAEKLAVIGRLRADLADGEADPYSDKAEELRLATETMMAAPEKIVREGIVFSFPRSTRIIPSIGTESLTEWVGTDWLAEEVMLSVDRVKEIYGVDLGTAYASYKPALGSPESGAGTLNRRTGSKGLACVWHVYDKATGMELVICEGYKDFLREPAAPKIFVDQFFPVFALTFNDVEHEGELFPKSDVELIRHAQLEYNRKKEAERQHRIAARPLYFASKGTFEEAETISLATHAAHDVVELNAMDKGMKAEDLVSPMKKIGVDPNLYETATTFQDIQRITGNSEATLGGSGNGTATESNIAESSRQGTLGLDGDDLDDMLSLVFRTASQVMLTELDAATVKEIVGIGAIWPTMSRSDIIKELWLSVKGGSSGRPDQAREAANFEKMAPLLIQVPGISPAWLAERMIRIADDSTDLEDAYIEGLPSILTQNKLAQMPAPDPMADPAAQGAEGADKTPRPGGAPGADTNSFPGPGAGGALQ